MKNLTALLSEGKSLLTSKTSLTVLLVLLFWLIADINQRLIDDESNRAEQQANHQVNQLKSLTVSEELQQAIAENLLPYDNDGEHNVNNDVNIMNAEQQAAQQGELNELFIGENSLTLKAILIDKGNAKLSQNNTPAKSAVLLIKNIKTNEVSIERFFENENVYGYELTIQSHIQIQLTKDNQQNQQNVILTMYKNNA